MKRSEFYAMFITMIILFTTSISYAVSYQVSVIQPTKPYLAFKYATTANTWHTVVDTVGVGILSNIKVLNSGNNFDNTKIKIKITIDGLEYTDENASTRSAAGEYFFDGTNAVANNRTVVFNSIVYFKSSLKVEFLHTHTEAAAMSSVVSYAVQ